MTMRLYVAQGKKTGIIKIGVTRNLPQRLKNLKTARKDEFNLIVSVPGTWFDETMACIYCRPPMFGREWFEPSAKTDKLVKFLTKNKRPSCSAWRML